jgi:hypothetical protein
MFVPKPIRLIGVVLLLMASCTMPQGSERMSVPQQPPLSQATPATSAPSFSSIGIGRFQLLSVPDDPMSPFLLDTVTGCLWHRLTQNDTKRVSFIEIDVENLHWSWGGGTQQVLAARIESSSLSDQQKRLFKDGLQKTACGVTNVVLTPGSVPTSGQLSGSGRESTGSTRGQSPPTDIPGQ